MSPYDVTSEFLMSCLILINILEKIVYKSNM